MRKLIRFLTVLMFITITFILSAKSMEAKENEEGLKFEQSYAEPGAFLSLEGEAKADWYRDDEKVASDSNSYQVTEDDLGHFICAEKDDDKVKLYCSRLPVMYIDKDGKEIEKETYIDAKLHIQGNGKFGDTLYNGNMQIKGRGNSTWLFHTKKPYKIKLEEKTDLFGFGKNKHWVLLANDVDDSFMRNTLSAKLSEMLGLVVMETEWVDVIIDGKYKGNYQLCEHIRIGKNRVNIHNWEDDADDVAKKIYEAEKENGMTKDQYSELKDAMEEDFSWIDGTFSIKYSDKNGGEEKEYNTKDLVNDLDISGGYLLESSEEYDEKSKFKTGNDIGVMFHEPELPGKKMFDFVKEYICLYDEAIHSEDGNAIFSEDNKILSGSAAEILGQANGNSVSTGSTRVHYSDLADMDSMVSFLLVNEILLNVDSYKKSRYAYKDRKNKLIFGPVWDFDLAAASDGADIASGTSSHNYWQARRLGTDNTDPDKPTWWNFMSQWIKDPLFVVKFREKYLQTREKILELTDEGEYFDECKKYLTESGAADEKIWSGARTFQEDIEVLRKYLIDRIEWMDEQLATNQSAMQSLGTLMQTGKDIKMTVEQDVSTDEGVSSMQSILKDSSEGIYDAECVVSGSVVVGISGSYDLDKKIYIDGRYYNTAKERVEIPFSKIKDEGGHVISVFEYNEGGALIGKNCLYILVPKEIINPNTPEESPSPSPVTSAAVSTEEPGSSFAPSGSPETTPESSIEPAKTGDPNQTLNPAQTIDPAKTINPEQTTDPSRTDEPETTQNPKQTLNPVQTIEPAKTINPEQTTDPSRTDEPETTQNPKQTLNPVQTIEPAKTINPEQTTDPSRTDEPGTTQNPKQTLNPVQTIEPAKTINPEQTTDPSRTNEPGTNSNPEQPTASAPATDPQITLSPAPWTEPYNSQTPDSTNAVIVPNNTLSPESSPAILAPLQEGNETISNSPEKEKHIIKIKVKRISKKKIKLILPKNTKATVKAINNILIVSGKWKKKAVFNSKKKGEIIIKCKFAKRGSLNVELKCDGYQNTSYNIELKKKNVNIIQRSNLLYMYQNICYNPYIWFKKY